MTDDDILEIGRLPGCSTSALASLIAMRKFDAEGVRASMYAMERVTGFSKSQLYRAREWLDKTAPGWRTPIVDGRRYQDPPAIVGPLAAEPEPTPERPVTAHQVIATVVGRGLSWRHAVDAALTRVEGKKSWDLYRDVYAPAADVLYDADNDAGVGDLIALTVDYLENICADEVDGPDRKRIAKLVRMHGKAALYGIHEAVPRTDVQTVHAYTLYAAAVAKNVVARIRQREDTTT